MTWGGGYFTAWSRRRQRISSHTLLAPLGMTQEEVEQCELEIWSKLASIPKTQEGESKGGERTLH